MNPDEITAGDNAGEAIVAQVQELVQKIMAADKAYHNTGRPIMSDQQYDGLKTLLKSLDPNHPVLSKVGDNPRETVWDKARHAIAMGSLEKLNTEDEFNEWNLKHPGKKVIQPKFDGLSLSMNYDNGIFQQAITRGDGVEGEDITQNVRRMVGFMEKMKDEFTGSIRCEINLLVHDLDRINSVLPEDDKYENCRNAASGISRRLDGMFCQYLALIYYDIGADFDEHKKIEALSMNGFMVAPTVFFESTEEGIKAFKDLGAKRLDLPYKIDGAVLKLNSWEEQKKLGSLNNKPKGQIAWKFDPPGSATTLLSVTPEVGRTGVITPLGHVEAVKIDGSTIRNVTLHNYDEIKRLGVGIGDLVMVIKSNDIIPKVISVIEHKGIPIPVPTECPICGTKVIQKESEDGEKGVFLYCPNDLCPARTHLRILNWIKVVGIDNFGESTLDALEQAGKVKSIRDIYMISMADIAAVTGGDKSAEKVFNNIFKARTLTADKIIAGIGIPGVSIKTAADLVKNFKTIHNILAAKVDDLVKIKGYSDISATAIVSGLQKFSAELKSMLEVLVVQVEIGDGPLAGKSFCFTGEMSKPRKQLQEMVIKRGGKNDSSITKTTTYLVCNEDAGSKKSQQAKKIGVTVITEQEFMGMVGVAPKPASVSDGKVSTYSLFDEA